MFSRVHGGVRGYPQSTQSDGPVRFLIFCSISISLLASLVASRRPQCNAGADKQGMYSTTSIHWNIKSASASPGRSRVGPALYVFSLLGDTRLPSAPNPNSVLHGTVHCEQFANFVRELLVNTASGSYSIPQLHCAVQIPPFPL
jgi:hypothetical protein